MLRRGVKSVACIACGACVEKAEAHAYEHGEPVSSTDATPEYLCPDCFADLSTADRDGLEQLLCHLQAGDVSTHEFLSRYEKAVRGTER